MLRTIGCLVIAIAAAGCTNLDGAAPILPVVAELPMDSLVKSLGPDASRLGITVIGGHDDRPREGVFLRHYVVDFAVPGNGAVALRALADKIAEVARQRHIRFADTATDGETYVSLHAPADSLDIRLEAVQARSPSPDFARYVFVWSETHRPPAR